MTDPLAGMTREQARSAVDEFRALLEERTGFSLVSVTMNEATVLLALAELGAECVGATKAWAPVRLVVDDPTVLTENGASAIRVLVLKEDR